MYMVCEIWGRRHSYGETILYQSHNPFMCFVIWLNAKRYFRKKYYTTLEEYSHVYMRFDIYKGKRKTCKS
jgi:hypothetical protein